MNIAVTGGAGFIGTHLVERLSAVGHTVSCLVLPGQKYQAIEGVTYHEGNISEQSSMIPQRSWSKNDCKSFRGLLFLDFFNNI